MNFLVILFLIALVSSEETHPPRETLSRKVHERRYPKFKREDIENAEEIPEEQRLNRPRLDPRLKLREDILERRKMDEHLRNLDLKKVYRKLEREEMILRSNIENRFKRDHPDLFLKDEEGFRSPKRIHIDSTDFKKFDPEGIRVHRKEKKAEE